jgi:WD40 repeat protein
MKRACVRAFVGAVGAGAVLLLAVRAKAQTLFVANYGGTITEVTTNGASSYFVTSVEEPYSVAFNNAGELFVGDLSGLRIWEFTPPSPTRSVFAPVVVAYGLAFNTAGDLFAAAGDQIDEFPPNGGSSNFASGLPGASALAFNSAGDLFVSDGNSGNIYEFATNGVQSTFASGLGRNSALGLAFNSTGDLFASWGSDGIYEITPMGHISTFASGGIFAGVAFNSAGNLFASAGKDIYEFTANGDESLFASGLGTPLGLAFQNLELPIPEPSTWALVGLGAIALLGVIRRRTDKRSFIT